MPGPDGMVGSGDEGSSPKGELVVSIAVRPGESETAGRRRAVPAPDFETMHEPAQEAARHVIPKRIMSATPEETIVGVANVHAPTRHPKIQIKPHHNYSPMGREGVKRRLQTTQLALVHPQGANWEHELHSPPHSRRDPNAGRVGGGGGLRDASKSFDHRWGVPAGIE